MTLTLFDKQRILKETRAKKPTLFHTTSRKKAVALSSHARVGGLMLFAPSGWGKSRFLGRRLCYQDAVRGVGTVILDTLGGTIDEALHKILYLPKAEQLAVGNRIRYCNMAGERIGTDIEQTLVTAWPMLSKRSSQDSLFALSQRNVDLIAKTDRNLATASVQGLNRLAPLLTSIGIVLAAFHEPLSSGFALLDNPAAWRQKLTALARQNREARAACKYLLSFFDLPDKLRAERSDVLRNKLSILEFDPISRAMFSASTPSVDWEEVCYKGLQVHIDLRNDIYSDQAKTLKLFWVWNSLMEYIKSRGTSGRKYPPLAVCIDELSYLVRGTSLNALEIIEDFREFVQVRKRNANIWLTAATQEIQDLPEPMQQACLGIHSQMFGKVTDYETAIKLAKRWCYEDVDPYFVKHWRTVWGSNHYQGQSFYFPISYEPEFMPLEEQWFLQSQKFRTLKKGEWLTAISKKEGEPASRVTLTRTYNLDPGMYVKDALVSEVRRRLMLRDGILVADVLESLDAQAQEQEALRVLEQEAALKAVSPNGSRHAPAVRTALSGQRGGERNGNAQTPDTKPKPRRRGRMPKPSPPESATPATLEDAQRSTDLASPAVAAEKSAKRLGNRE